MESFLYPVINVEETSRKLKRLRKERNISISELQKIFNFTYPQAIYKWEDPAKKTLPTLDNLVVLANFYKVSIDELIVIKSVKMEELFIHEAHPVYGISKETLNFIKENSSKKILKALGKYFNCQLN